MKQRLFAAALAAALLLPRLAPAAPSPDLASADLAPGDALIFLSLPDPKRSIAAWKGSSLYKIWQEPEVREFFGKSVSQIPPIPEEATQILGKVDALEARNLFVAITSFDQRKPGVVMGFTFTGGRPALDPILEKAVAGIRKSEPDGKPSVVTYGTRSIETFEGRKNTIALCVADKWCFVGSSIDAVKGLLDRLDKKGGVPPALSEKSEFKTVASRLPATHETFVYVYATPLMGMLSSLLDSSGVKFPAESRREMEQLKAFGATTATEGGRLRDTIFGLTSAGAAPGSLSYRSLAFTTPETLLYATSMLKFPDEPAAGGDKAANDDPSGKAGAPRRAPNAAKEPMAKILADLEAAGLPLSDLKAALSNEASLLLEWPQGAPWPSPILCLEVKDRVLVQKLIERAVTKAGQPKNAEWKVKVEDGVEYRSLVATAQGNKAITPTMALTDRHLLAGINPTEVRSAIVRSRAASTSRLDASPTYKSAMGSGAAPDQTLLYVDTRALFEKAYGLARSFAPALSDNPQVTGMFDLEKLPNIEAIARHLPPISLTTRKTADGVLLESSGPLTAPQLLAAGVGAVGAGANYFKAAKPAIKPPPSTKPPGQEEEANKDEAGAGARKKKK